MIIVKIPKDIKSIEKKMMFNLTARQLISLIIGIILGILVYFTTKQFLDKTISLYLLMFTAMIPFLIGKYQSPSGLRFEDIMRNKIENKIRPQKRLCKTEYIKDIRVD